MERDRYWVSICLSAEGLRLRSVICVSVQMAEQCNTCTNTHLHSVNIELPLTYFRNRNMHFLSFEINLKSLFLYLHQSKKTRENDALGGSRGEYQPNFIKSFPPLFYCSRLFWLKHCLMYCLQPQIFLSKPEPLNLSKQQQVYFCWTHLLFCHSYLSSAFNRAAFTFQVDAWFHFQEAVINLCFTVNEGVFGRPDLTIGTAILEPCSQARKGHCCDQSHYTICTGAGIEGKPGPFVPTLLNVRVIKR